MDVYKFISWIGIKFSPSIPVNSLSVKVIYSRVLNSAGLSTELLGIILKHSVNLFQAFLSFQQQRTVSITQEAKSV
ncbi:MAG: hypothetical protein H6Q19_1478 [Bacteroidetes bacterium]|nr:hypothetical protein [Bacteroidota bacterium]